MKLKKTTEIKTIDKVVNKYKEVFINKEDNALKRQKKRLKKLKKSEKKLKMEKELNQILHLSSWDISLDIEKYTVIITPTAYREINRIYEYLEFELYAENATKEL